MGYWLPNKTRENMIGKNHFPEFLPPYFPLCIQEKKWPNLFLKKFQINFTKNRKKLKKENSKRNKGNLKQNKENSLENFLDLSKLLFPTKKTRKNKLILIWQIEKEKFIFYSVFPLFCSVYEIVKSNCLDKLNKIGFHYNDDSILWDFPFFAILWEIEWNKKKLVWWKF